MALRLILLPRHPVPTPNIYDEFAHLLVADTLRHFRLANPVHPLHRFFETFFTLQEPSYSSIYPLGPGLAMALGRAIFGTPWAGVLLGTAAFCSLCYWMLRAWTTPLWALIGGTLAVIEFGPLSEWTNTYWGGSVAACAGCLVFGALPRLRESGRRRDAILLGAGLGLHLLTRPYESIFLLLSVILFFAPWRRVPFKLAGVAALAALPAVALMLLQNKQVTGSWSTLPYMLSQQQYGVPTSLTFQAAPVPHRELTPQQALEYQSQMSYRERNGETVLSYLLRLEYRVRYYRFFFLPALYLVLPFFFLSLRKYRFVWVALTLLIFALGANFYPFFYPHYIAALTCLFVLVSVTGLRELCRLPIPTGREAAWIILALCGAHFVLWYGLHLFDPPADASVRDLGRHQSCESGTEDRHQPRLGRPSWATARDRPLLSPSHFSRGVGVQRSRHRRGTHRLGARPRPAAERRSTALLPGPHGMAAGAGRAASELDALSALNCLRAVVRFAGGGRRLIVDMLQNKW